MPIEPGFEAVALGRPVRRSMSQQGGDDLDGVRSGQQGLDAVARRRHAAGGGQRRPHVSVKDRKPPETQEQLDAARELDPGGHPPRVDVDVRL
jgi:hypothetical protein